MGIRAVRSHFKNTKKGGSLIMRKLSIFVMALMVLAAFSVAQQKAFGAETVHLYLKMTGKVTQVNPTGKTFTVMAKGKPFTFGSKSLKVLPKVGEVIDITYTEKPGGPMEATTINTLTDPSQKPAAIAVEDEGAQGPKTRTK